VRVEGLVARLLPISCATAKAALMAALWFILIAICISAAFYALLYLEASGSGKLSPGVGFAFIVWLMSVGFFGLISFVVAFTIYFDKYLPRGALFVSPTASCEVRVPPNNSLERSRER
jgi:hypothetical protein